MAQGKKTDPAIKEECVLRYKNGETPKSLCNEYGIAERTFYRWVELYDGTRESLKNKSSRPHSPHPNEMTPEEVRLMIAIVTENPHISNRELAERIGTGRTPTSFSRKREKYFGKRTTAFKYDFATIFKKDEVDRLNEMDAARGDIPFDFYAIEVLPDLYLRENEGHYPVCITPYFTVAVKFENLKDAKSFLKLCKSDNMRWKPKVRHIINGLPVKSLLE